MASQLFQQMQSQNLQSVNKPQIDKIKNMASMLKGNSNPMQMLQLLCAQNPQLNSIIQMMNGTGMKPKQMFMNMAKQQGIDPNTIISMLK